jgi:SNF2 family DNA or RNA helicase
MIKLEPHQHGIVNEILNRPNVLVVAPMGAGKTMATLVAVTTLLLRSASSPDDSTQRRIKNVLIIAPKRVAMSVWVQEADSCNMGLSIRFCKTALDIKLFLMEQSHHHIAVCSVTRIEEIPNGCWDMVIIDESTMFGNKSSLRSKEARRICRGVPRRVLLTGTPIHGGYEKLMHQIFLLDGGETLGKTLTSFRDNFMKVKYHVKGVVTVWEIVESKIPDLQNAIAHLLYVVRDSVKMPDALYKNVYVELPPKRMEEYKTFERESIIEFNAENGKAFDTSLKTLVAFAASARGAKLRQLASGCVYADVDNATFSITHNEKIDEITELYNRMDSPILLVYAFKSELTTLKKTFPKARQLNNEQDIADWNGGKIPIALVHPASVGHGLNLQFGGFTVVWYSLTYDAELYAQTNKRLDRRGQKEIVSIIHLIAKGTIDEKILKILQEKSRLADEF